MAVHQPLYSPGSRMNPRLGGENGSIVPKTPLYVLEKPARQHRTPLPRLRGANRPFVSPPPGPRLCKGRDRVLRETLKPQQRSSRAGVRISYNDDRIHLPQTRACCSLDAKQLDDHREYVFHLSCWITIPLYYQQKPPPFRVVRQRRSCHYREGYCGNKTTGHGIS